jgi:hypothetical protein
MAAPAALACAAADPPADRVILSALLLDLFSLSTIGYPNFS